MYVGSAGSDSYNRFSLCPPCLRALRVPSTVAQRSPSPRRSTQPQMHCDAGRVAQDHGPDPAQVVEEGVEPAALAHEGHAGGADGGVQACGPAGRTGLDSATRNQDIRAAASAQETGGKRIFSEKTVACELVSGRFPISGFFSQVCPAYADKETERQVDFQNLRFMAIFPPPAQKLRTSGPVHPRGLFLPVAPPAWSDGHGGAYNRHEAKGNDSITTQGKAMTYRKAGVEVVEEGAQPIIRIHGQFDFLLNADFRDAYRRFPPESRFVLDMTDVEAIDSSALGMLLMLREYAGDESARIVLRGLSDDVRRVLELSNFDRLFRLE